MLCWIFIPDVLTEDIPIVYLTLNSLNLVEIFVARVNDGTRNLHSTQRKMYYENSVVKCVILGMLLE